MKFMYIVVDERPTRCFDCLYFHQLPQDKEKGYCDAVPDSSQHVWTNQAKVRRLSWHCPLQSYSGDIK